MMNSSRFTTTRMVAMMAATILFCQLAGRAGEKTVANGAKRIVLE